MDETQSNEELKQSNEELKERVEALELRQRLTAAIIKDILKSLLLLQKVMVELNE